MEGASWAPSMRRTPLGRYRRLRSRRAPAANRAAHAARLPPVPSRKVRPEITPEQAAKVAIARRAKPASRPDYVKLVLTLELRRVLAARLSARAIREGKNLEGVVIDPARGCGEVTMARDPRKVGLIGELLEASPQLVLRP